MSFTRAWNALNCWRCAMLRRTHHLFRFFSFSFSSSSIICCSTANAPSKIACASSLLLLQLSAIAVKKHVCVCNGLHLMTSFTQLFPTRLFSHDYVWHVLVWVTCTRYSYMWHPLSEFTSSTGSIYVFPYVNSPDSVNKFGVSTGVYRGGVVVTTSACQAGGTGSIPGAGSCDIKICLSTLGTVYSSWIGESH